jgi:hypothetical protein
MDDFGLVLGHYRRSADGQNLYVTAFRPIVSLSDPAFTFNDESTFESPIVGLYMRSNTNKDWQRRAHAALEQLLRGGFESNCNNVLQRAPDLVALFVYTAPTTFQKTEFLRTDICVYGSYFTSFPEPEVAGSSETSAKKSKKPPPPKKRSDLSLRLETGQLSELMEWSEMFNQMVMHPCTRGQQISSDMKASMLSFYRHFAVPHAPPAVRDHAQEEDTLEKASDMLESCIESLKRNAAVVWPEETEAAHMHSEFSVRPNKLRKVSHHGEVFEFEDALKEYEKEYEMYRTCDDVRKLRALHDVVGELSRKKPKK